MSGSTPFAETCKPFEVSAKPPTAAARHVRAPPNGVRMALADISATLSGGLPHQTCGTCHALAQMSEDDAATLRRLLADRTVRFKDLAKLMAGDPETPTVSWEALSRHARGGCSAREFLR